MLNNQRDMKQFKPKENGVQLPWNDIDFINTWQEWLAYRSERRLPKYVPRGLKATFTELFNDAGGDPKTAIAMINQSIAKNWQGIFKIKGQKNEQQQGNNNNATRQSVNDLYNQRFGKGG